MCPIDSPRSLDNLLRKEATTFLGNQNHFLAPHPFDRSYISDDSDEIIEEMIQNDPGFDSMVAISPLGERDPTTWSWLSTARQKSINWVLTIRASCQLQLRTAYTTLVYLDRFLAMLRTLLGVEDIDGLVSTISKVCLHLAAKVEEDFVPLQYAQGGDRMAKAEFMFASILEWRLFLVTPFIYLRYFVNKFYKEKDPREVVPSAIDVIMGAIRVIDLGSGGESIIAASAVLVAVDPYLWWRGVQSKARLIPSWGSEQYKQVFACYKIMKEVNRQWIGRPYLVFPPNL